MTRIWREKFADIMSTSKEGLVEVGLDCFFIEREAHDV